LPPRSRRARGLATRAGTPFPSLGSRDKPAQNADGTTDLYLCPKAPDGKQGNWLATVPGKGYFAILRLYGPTEAAINKTWKPGDIEKVPGSLATAPPISERALNPPQLWASNFPQFCRGG
jgi:hypothetical protein